MKAWVDIDNPPQARYLLPVARHLESAGHHVLLTARAYGDTFAILRSEGADFDAVGTSFGRGLLHKLYGLKQRTETLVDYISRQREPIGLVVTGSRAATLAARRLGIPSFVIIDYEYVNVGVYAYARSHILHPKAIDGTTFVRRGVRRSRLIPFDGLKEDISFADVELDPVQPYEFAGSAPADVRVLFRPPAEESHYYRSDTGRVSHELLRYLAKKDVRLVFSPRYEQQIDQLDRIGDWRRDPIVLREPAPFVALLKAVDAVVSAGGTMLREAAFLGVPAYSIFRGRTGGVDRYLATIGRLVLLRSASDFPRSFPAARGRIAPLRTGAEIAQSIVEKVLERAMP